MNLYEDIINLKHHTSKKHPRMPIYKRAAIFAPFAALTGYSDAVYETARLTKEKIELSNEEKLELSEKLNYIRDNLINKKEVMFTYFVPDKRKKGGEYINRSGVVKKIDLYNRKIIFSDGALLKIDNIIEIIF